MLSKAPDADEIPHPRFPTSGRLVAVRPTAQGLCAVATEDDDYFDPIPLADHDVRQYSVSVPKLVELIRQQNGIQGDTERAEAGLIPLGQKTVDGYGVVEVYLSLPNAIVQECAARFLSLVTPTGAKKLVVLLPCPVGLSAKDRQLLDANRVVLIPLSPLADNGSLVVDWDAQVIETPEDRPDGVCPPRTIVVGGREYRCNVTKREMTFLEIALRNEEVELGHIIHRGQDAIWKETFADAQKTRNKVTQFLSRLNRKLNGADPQFPFLFSLPRGRRSIARSSEPDAV